MSGAIMLPTALPANAACTPRPTVTITSPAAIGNYNPFTASPTVTAVVSIVNRDNAPCNFSLSFFRSSLPATMANGTSSLTYTIQSGGNALFYTSGTPLPNQRVDINNVAGGATVTQSVAVSPSAGQVVASGNYVNNSVTAEVFDNIGGILSQPRAAAFPVTATVVGVCNLPAPTASSLDFSSAISQGLPNPASTQATSIVNAQCTAPTRVQLSGNSLQASPLGPAKPGFDNFINWSAQATFGSASVTLTTTGLSATPPVTSVAQNMAAQGSTSGTISIGNIHLIAGNPVIAGSYSSTLTITIDPSL
jgi:hypothetical protein